MRKILFIDDDDDIRKLYTPILDNLGEGIKVTESISGNKAISLLREDREYDLIICDYEMDDGDGRVVYNYTKKSNLKIPFILYTTKNPEDISDLIEGLKETERYLKKPSSIKKFKAEILDILGIEERKTEYSKIRCTYFWRYNECMCDIYIKLSVQKFVKIFNAGSQYTKDDIDKYIKKNQRFLYIKTSDLNNYLEKTKNSSFLILNPNVEKDEDIIRTTHAIIHDMALSLGVTKESIELTESIAKETIRAVKDSNELYKYLIRARNNKDYIYDHSYLVSILCCELATRMEWSDRRTLEKLCWAALFHDITLEEPRLAMIQSLEAKELKDYGPTARKAYENHSIDAANLLKSAPGIPPDVDSIVLCHHELPKGKGFPRQLAPDRVFPLARVFILCHDFVSQLYNFGFDEDYTQSIVGNMGETYLKIKEYRDFFQKFKDIVEGRDDR